MGGLNCIDIANSVSIASLGIVELEPASAYDVVWVSILLVSAVWAAEVPWDGHVVAAFASLSLDITKVADVNGAASGMLE